MKTKAYGATLYDLQGLDVAVALIPLHTEQRAEAEPQCVAARPASAELTGWDLLGADPEIDLQQVGRMVPHLRRVYVSQATGQIPATAPVRIDTVSTLQRQRTSLASAGMVPIKRQPLQALAMGSQKLYDVVHRDGAGYALLHRLAAELQRTGQALELTGQAGLPIAIRKGGRAQRVLLSGSVDGPGYSLRLHCCQL